MKYFCYYLIFSIVATSLLIILLRIKYVAENKKFRTYLRVKQEVMYYENKYIKFGRIVQIIGDTIFLINADLKIVKKNRSQIYPKENLC